MTDSQDVSTAVGSPGSAAVSADPATPGTLFSADRVAAACRAAGAAGLDALLISPGPDLRYLTGYDALPLERLTCLVVPGRRRPVRGRPERWSVPLRPRRPLGAAGVELLAWEETDDPYALVARLLPGASTVAVDDHMWAEKVLGFRRRAARHRPDPRRRGAA